MPSLIAGFPPARPAGLGQQAPLRGLVARESLFERLSAGARSFWSAHQPEAARPCCCAHGCRRRA